MSDGSDDITHPDPTPAPEPQYDPPIWLMVVFAMVVALVMCMALGFDIGKMSRDQEVALLEGKVEVIKQAAEFHKETLSRVEYDLRQCEAQREMP